MTNIFDEIEEDLRKQRMEQLWKRHGKLIMTIATLFVLAVAGWRGYASWELAQAQKNGDRYLSALRLADQGKHEDAASALSELSKTTSGAYPVLARMSAAGELAAAGKQAEAAGAFAAIGADSSIDGNLRDVARLRAAMLLVDLNPKDVPALISGLAEPKQPLRNLARETLGLAALKTGDKAKAAAWFNDLSFDAETPSGARSRATLVLALLAADGVSPPGSGATQ